MMTLESGVKGGTVGSTTGMRYKGRIFMEGSSGMGRQSEGR